MTISEHSESESSSLHSSEGGQSSLLGATNSSGHISTICFKVAEITNDNRAEKLQIWTKMRQKVTDWRTESLTD